MVCEMTIQCFCFRRPEDNEHFSSFFTEDSDDDKDVLDSGVFMFTHPSDVFQQFDELFANFERTFRSFETFQLPSIDFLPGTIFKFGCPYC